MVTKCKELFDGLLNSQNYDLRTSNNGRWMDQKVTPDVLAFVADSVLNYIEVTGSKSFTSKDIWNSNYTRELLMHLFKKVDPQSPAASNEYDKFFQQPLKMLAYAGVLRESEKRKFITFTVVRQDILEMIRYENNALDFIIAYVTKVLKDSGEYHVFEAFFREQTKDSFCILKESFEHFTHANTPIKGIAEPRRIFTKVINPLAFAHNSKGTRSGHISDSIIQKNELMYNRDNFRDVDKPKGVTRKEYAAKNPKDQFSCDYVGYMSQKAKAFVKCYNEQHNGGLSEIKTTENTSSLQIHHMFMVSEHPEISYYVENLIALTPNQHMTQAHPNNNTQVVDLKYRCRCLVHKLRTIRIDEERHINEYDIERFKEVLSIGFSDESFKAIQGHDYDALEKKIRTLCTTKYKCSEESLTVV